jgi:hypothetical protein
VPYTQHNIELKNRFASRIKDVTTAFMQQISDKETDRLQKSLDKNPKMDLSTSDDLREAISIIESELDRLSSPSELMRMTSRIQVARDIGKTIQDFLGSEIETANMHWTFRSRLGYKITFPSGWEIVGKKHKNSAIEQYQGSPLTIDEVFNNMLVVPDTWLIICERSERQLSVDELAEEFKKLTISNSLTLETIAGTEVIIAELNDGNRFEYVLYFPSSHLRLQFRFNGTLERALSVKEHARQIAESIELKQKDEMKGKEPPIGLLE